MYVALFFLRTLGIFLSFIAEVVRSKSTSSGQEHEQAKGTVWFAVRDFCGAFLILDTFPRHMGTKIAWSSLPQLLPQKVQRTEWIQWIMQTAN
jgi:hypothetical protein